MKYVVVDLEMNPIAKEHKEERKNTSKTATTQQKNNTSRSNDVNSYDEGYDAVYEDDDYDSDRYNRDSEYADGVDDALEDMEDEDWD